MKKGIYTAVAGGRDVVRVPQIIREDWDYICFSDLPDSSVPAPWINYPIGRNIDDPKRTVKQFKVKPFEFLAEFDFTVWVDANFLIEEGFDEVVNSMIEHDQDLFVFPHQERGCIYKEAEVVKKMGLEKPEIVDAQIRRLRNADFPEDFGLVETGTLVRRKGLEIDQFFADWWREICAFSSRDQLSFMYCVWKLKPKMCISTTTSRDASYHRWLPHSDNQLSLHRIIKKAARNMRLRLGLSPRSGFQVRRAIPAAQEDVFQGQADQTGSTATGFGEADGGPERPGRL